MSELRCKKVQEGTTAEVSDTNEDEDNEEAKSGESEVSDTNEDKEKDEAKSEESDSEQDEDDDKKQEEYYYSQDTHFNYEENTYDELIEIRNILISTRPEWMNTEKFINYENKYFRYNINFEKADKNWNEWNETKIKGNGICPLCRAIPI